MTITKIAPNWLRRLAKRLQNSEALDVRENPIIHYFPDVGHNGEITIDCVITPSAGSDLYDHALLEQRERIGKGVARHTRGHSVIDRAEERGNPGILGALWIDHDGKFARRLVACWNACEGLDTETLETAAIGPNAKEWFEAWGQYHQLLNKLDQITSDTDGLIVTLQESLAKTAAQRDELVAALDDLPGWFDDHVCAGAETKTKLARVRAAMASAKGGAA